MCVNSQRPLHHTGEYLARERKAAVRSEFRDGQIHPMPRSNRWHSRIVVNLIGELRSALQGSPWETLAIDMRLRVDSGFYTYPDLSVSRDPRFEDQREDVLLNPAVLIEVLSPLTADYDRGTKFSRYRAMDSVQEVLFVHREKPLVEHYVRQARTMDRGS